MRRSREVAHVTHWTWTRANKVTWSDEMKRIFGLDPVTFEGDLDEVINMRSTPTTALVFFAMNEAVIHDARPPTQNTASSGPDGTVRSVLARPGERVTDARALSSVVWHCPGCDETSAENELRRNLQRLSIATRPAAWAFGRATFRSGFQMWDERTQAIYGSSGDEVPATYERWMQPVHPDDLPGVLANEQAAIERGVSIHNRFRIVRPDGAIRHVETHAEPALARTDARVPGRRRSGCKPSGWRAKAFGCNMLRWPPANHIVITDANGSIQWVNPAFSHLTGYSAAEALYRNPRELVRSGKHPGDFTKNSGIRSSTAKSGAANSSTGARTAPSTTKSKRSPRAQRRGQITILLPSSRMCRSVSATREESFKLMWRCAQAEQLTQIIRSVPEVFCCSTSTMSCRQIRRATSCSTK